MKKFVLILAILFVFSVTARAEMSAAFYSGKDYRSQQVFADFYNNFGDTITENTVVILDTATAVRAATGSYFGAYMTVDPGNATDNVYVLGVTDEYVPTAAVGRVCIRGPHKVYATTGYYKPGVCDKFLVGTNPSPGTLAGTNFGVTGQAAKYTTADATAGGQLGLFLASDNVVGSVWWIWVKPQVHS
jgi:hypothetical protein